jgi:hypothetical protein
MSIEGKIQCPRCGRVYTLTYPNNDIECNCYLYCEDGDEVSDCSVTKYNFTGQLGWPTGASTSNEDRGDDKIHAARYCSTHNKYIYKDVIVLELDWDVFLGERITPGKRFSNWKKG